MPQPSPGATVPRQFRLAPETLDLLDRISSHYGLGSRADAIRVAARHAADALPAPPPTPTPAAPKRKSRKKKEGD